MVAKNLCSSINIIFMTNTLQSADSAGADTTHAMYLSNNYQLVKS